MKSKKLPIPLIVSVLVVVLGLTGFGWVKNQSKSPVSAPQKPQPKPTMAPVNLIDVAERPYVTLQPLTSRNDLALTIHHLPKKADSVEVTLEYDRNQGVLDAVLKQFPLSFLPLKETIFLGSKSAGGHITYHDDVVGGTMTLQFMGGKDGYALKVPWRYADTQKEYTDLSTSDGFFQITFNPPIKQPKIIVMQSPGAPEGLKGDLIAGPYLVTTVGVLPQTTANLKIRLSETADSAKLMAYNQGKWQTLESTLDGKTLTAETPLVECFVVVK